MRTKNDIIQELYLSDEFNMCISKMKPVDLQDDLRQQVILILLEVDTEKIVRLSEAKELSFYVAKIILNQVKNPRNEFQKNFKSHFEELTNKEIADDFQIEEREFQEHIEDAAISEVERLHWYNKGLIDLYVEHGNYRSIERVTGIPFGSAYKTIKKSLAQVKCNVMQIKEIVPEKVKL